MVYRTGTRRGVAAPARILFANAVQWAAGGAPPLWIEGLPIVSEYSRCRPYDERIVPTHEFFPMLGENSYLIIVASYWAEAGTVRVGVDLPEGIDLHECNVTELIKGAAPKIAASQHQLKVTVPITMEDVLLLYLVELPAGARQR